jgi:hypothetical protein
MSREDFRKTIAGDLSSLPKTYPLVHEERKEGPLVPPSPLTPLPPTPKPSELQPEATLPDFKRASKIIDSQIVLPDLVIEDLLHRGCKLAIGGGSKSFKSWTLMDLGVSIASGGTWWDLKCKQGTVLYLNFELIEGFFEKRLLAICKAKGIHLPDSFMYWSLRSKCYDLGVLEKVLQQRQKEVGQIDLIIIDPMYKALGDLDENSAGDMTKLMGQIERIADRIGAAIAFGTHFSKGNQSAKESMDRISGSGVFGRDPDAILTMTRHKEDSCYVIDSTLRYLPALEPFVVRWGFPTMTVDESLDPQDLMQQGRGATERSPAGVEVTADQLIETLPYEGLRGEAWRQRTMDVFGSQIPNFTPIKKELLSTGRVVKKRQVYYRVRFELQQQPRSW